MNKIVTFGEILLRLTTLNKERFTQSKNFEITYAGSECNVAVSLSHFGMTTHYVSSVPDNPIGQVVLILLGNTALVLITLLNKEKDLRFIIWKMEHLCDLLILFMTEQVLHFL